MWSLTCSRFDLSERGFVAACSPRGSRLQRSGRGVPCRRAGSARCNASSAANVEVGSSGPATSFQVRADTRRSVSISNLPQVVGDDLLNLNKNLKSIVGAKNPILVSAAEQIFGAGGKRLRPALVFLVSRATSQIAGFKELTRQHQRLAEIIEMIHTASLIHDDVLDDSGMRRDL
ncbi:Solanesyl-diphosphate synthase 2, chloroplastic [Apostasia shenzhenica]|uniref:Solanesyl-diphosphate synthase 2, chloroplastic n=1 Tax=Apostasia shenzhenica TaxID=1088818 RepID=A0A2I0BAA3_9ASPA|nr:Solanesyl-diphosphate synthase 2, chloroplastic [Apostasia shenzhenica]